MYALQQLTKAKVALFLTLVFAASYAQCQNINLPQQSSPSFNFDEITTSNGVRCRQAQGSATRLEMGALDSDQGGLGVYGRVVIPLGAQPDRLDCKRLYNLEVNKLQQEILDLRERLKYSRP